MLTTQFTHSVGTHYLESEWHPFSDVSRYPALQISKIQKGVSHAQKSHRSRLARASGENERHVTTRVGT